MRFTIFFFFLIMLFSACQETANPINPEKKTNIFFDLKGFFQKEMIQLKDLKSFQKTVSINDKTEQQQLEKLDLDNELSIFIASDINRPAWSDKYKVDSVFSNQQQLIQINYIALDDKLKTKKLIIDFQNNVVAKISVEKAVDNAVAQSTQELIYKVGKGYSIQSVQSLSYSEIKTIKVEVEYL